MSTMIRVLDESTANKIAAGEVVERPASVIKELVENSIDAGSNKIEVEIMSGGISFMRVTDNGCGMSETDAKMAILRHATSKLQKVGDLSSLATLGFRGEALPTIASVSKFTLLTRRAENDFATLVEIEGGKIKEIREAGGAVGTTVKAQDLFFNTPARKKFLKTPVSEGSHINETMVKLAVSNPGIAFKFINNNKLVIATPGSGDLFSALQSIYGKKVSDELISLAFSDEDLKISGYLSKPTVIRSSRQWQHYIVNGRVISSRFIAKALDNAYHSLLPKSGYPLAVLCIEVPQNTIDVNVHPQKSEMKFADEGRIFKAVYKAVLDAIKTPDTLEHIAAPVQEAHRYYTPLPFQAAVQRPPGSRQSPAAFAPREPGGQAQTDHTFAKAQENKAGQYKFPESQPEVVRENGGEDAGTAFLAGQSGLLPMGQVDRCFIVAQDAKGLYIVDQHAAHERILYDRFAKMADEIPSQQLLVHIFLDFTEKECGLVLGNMALFESLGFAMEPSGPLNLRLKEIPSDIPVGEAEAVVREILAALQDMRQPTAKEIRHACLAITACRAAIKAGDVLNLRQMQILLDELACTDLPYTCPHGRPSIVKFDSGELAKMFKRT